MLIDIQLWRDREDLTVIGLDQLPLPFVNHPVMPIAEQDQVWLVRSAAFDPMHQVMA